MNSALFKQADSRWGKKPYPSGSTMAGCGCGCVACTHIIIEQDKYKNYTPENVRPYMVSQGFAIRGQGTTWNGITKTLQHYGYKVVHIGINDPMSKAWTELNKGNRIGIILFRGGRGPNGTVWTAGGHYVAFTDYKMKDGLHYFYTKDSGGRNHDSAKYGYYSYERSMKGVVYQMWIVERINAPKVATTVAQVVKTATASAAPKTLTVDGKGGVSTVKATQKFFGTKQDGVITGQKKANKKFYSSLTSVKFGKGGSVTVKKLQSWVGAKPDGVLGQGTAKKWQSKLKKLGYYNGAIDGHFGPKSMKAWQKALNNGCKSIAPAPAPKPAPAPTPAPKPTPKPTPKPAKTGSKVELKAKELAWAKGTKKAKYAFRGGAPTSQFKKAFNKVFPTHNKWGKGPKTGASCDVGAATCVRAAGVEPKMPRGYTEMLKYKPKNMKKLTYKNVAPASVAKPGDLVCYTKNKSGSSRHVIIMGKGCIYESQYQKTYFHVNSSMSKVKVKRPKVVIFREK